MALVVNGNVLVGSPGAPGCTTTGAGRSACWAETGSDNKAKRELAAISPLRHVATPLTDWSWGLSLQYKDFIGLDSSTGDFNLSQGGTVVTHVRLVGASFQNSTHVPRFS